MTATALRDASDSRLADLYGQVSYDDEARELIEAEGLRRDRSERQRGQWAAVRSEWAEAAHGQMIAASHACAGRLVDKRHAPAWVTDWHLWTCTPTQAERWASEELRGYWADHPRHGLGDYRGRIAQGKRIQLDEIDRAALNDTQPEPAPRETTMIGEIAGAAMHAARDAGRVTEQAARVARYQQMGQAKAARMAGEARGEGEVAVREPSAVIARRIPDAPALLRRTLEGMGLLFTDYVAFPSRSSVIAVVTWNAQAAARNADGDSIWRSYIRLLLTSRENGSGKSTVADISRMLLQCRAGRMSKVTPYGLTKVLGVFKEVAIADDAQNVFRSDKAGAELLTIMINGYTPGATWVSGKSDGKVEPASGPLMIVGKDALIRERAEYLKDLIDRSAVVRMERPDHYMPEVDEDAEARARSLAVTLKAVTGALEAPLRQAARELAEENRGRLITDGDGGRTAQIWRPMLAVAKVAGDQWYDATLQAMEDLSSAGGDLLKAEDALTELEDLRDDGRSFWDAVPAHSAPVGDDLYEEE